jgi:hypothetical protein
MIIVLCIYIGACLCAAIKFNYDSGNPWDASAVVMLLLSPFAVPATIFGAYLDARRERRRSRS